MLRTWPYLIVNGFLLLVVLQNWSGRTIPGIDFLHEMLTLPFIAIQLVMSIFVLFQWIRTRHMPGMWPRLNLAISILIVYSFVAA